MDLNNVLVIDFGTTNVTASYWNIDKPDYAYSTACKASDDVLETIIVENVAPKDRIINLLDIKRYIGKSSIESAETKKKLDTILRKILRDAMNIIKRQLSGIVIVVPGHFNLLQRKVIKDVAEEANINLVRLISVPLAIAGFLHPLRQKNDKPEQLLLFDFGGGALDVSVVRLSPNLIEIIAVAGVLDLGGKDFDINLAKNLKKKYSIEGSEEEYQQLIAACEAAKVTLSSKECVNIAGKFSQGKNITITRKEFERLNEDLIKKAFDVTVSCVESNKIKKKQIDKVYLVGGSSRIPKIIKKLIDYFGKEKISLLNEFESIPSLGAHYILKFSNSCIFDKLSSSLGYEKDGHMEFIIKKGTPIPCDKPIKFIPHNECVVLSIYQGESRKPEENAFISTIIIKTLKDPIEVKFFIDESEYLDIDCVDENKRQVNYCVENTRLDQKKDPKDEQREKMFKQIEDIHEKTKELRKDVEKFVGAKDCNEFYYLDESLVSNMEDLDRIKVTGFDDVRSKRKDALLFVSETHKMLLSRATEISTGIAEDTPEDIKNRIFEFLEKLGKIRASSDLDRKKVDVIFKNIAEKIAKNN